MAEFSWKRVLKILLGSLLLLGALGIGGWVEDAGVGILILGPTIFLLLLFGAVFLLSGFNVSFKNNKSASVALLLVFLFLFIMFILTKDQFREVLRVF